MNRLLVVLLLFLVLLALAESRIRRHQLEERVRGSTLRPLTSLPISQIGEFELELGNRRWRYVRREGLWRCPAYFDAVLQVEALDLLLGGLLASRGTVVSSEPGDLAHYGLDPRQSLRVALRDPRGQILLEVRIGRGAPGPRAREVYVQLAGQDTIYHLHANPWLALDDPELPLVDRHVLPRALFSSPPLEIAFVRRHYPLQRLRRLETRPTPLPLLPSQEPESRWIATLDSGDRVCFAASAAAYADFLARLRYTALQPPTAFVPGEGALILKDADGRIDTLEVSSQDGQGNVFLRLRPLGQVCTLASRKAALLFPSMAALFESLPQPSPYQLAESEE